MNWSKVGQWLWELITARDEVVGSGRLYRIGYVGVQESVEVRAGNAVEAAAQLGRISGVQQVQVVVVATGEVLIIDRQVGLVEPGESERVLGETRYQEWCKTSGPIAYTIGRIQRSGPR